MRGIVLLLVLAVPTFFLWLGRPAITDSDEAYYAEAGREMVESGNWVTPYFNYEPRFEKPILFYWLVASSYVTAGVKETPARFWSALSGLGLCLVVYGCARRWFDGASGLLAGAMVATSAGIFAIAREALPDLPLAFFVTAGTWAAIEAVSTESVVRRRWTLLASASLALGFLDKGPIALVLPAAVLVSLIVWRWMSDGRSALRWPAFGDLAIAAALFVVIAAPWYVMVTRQNGVGYLYRFFVGENLERFATAKYNDPRPFWYYVPIAIAALLPWSPFMLLWIKPAIRVLRRQRSPTDVERRIVCWTIAPLLVLTMSIGKQPRYILPCLPPLAMLLAHTIRTRAASTRTQGRSGLLAVSGVVAGLVVITLAWVIHRAEPLLVVVNPSFDSVGIAVIAGAGSVLAFVAFAAQRALPATAALAAALTLLSAHHSVMMIGRPEPVEIMAAQARAAGSDATICTCGAFGRNLAFYTGRMTTMADYDEGVRGLLSSSGHTVAAIDADVLARAEATMGRRFTRLADVMYLNTALLRVEMFLHPNPSTQLQRVLFISNR